MKKLAIFIMAVLAATGVAEGHWSRYSNKTAMISYELPSSWQVENEHNLEQAGYLFGPYPTYELIAGGEPATLGGVPNPPGVYAFSETPRPWFMAFVDTGASPAPLPSVAYQLAPDGEMTLQREQGLEPSLVNLTEPADVYSGDVRGSVDRSELVVPGAGEIELNEVGYTKGNTVWEAMVGCTVACYNANEATINQVINSVRVGPAAL
ncbi:MAG TPA: hypothetical protein VEJ84_15400 [Acidimicrobiales bacterium]|nr:hypothetical protein [Acidimicrobiales bacterium]